MSTPAAAIPATTNSQNAFCVRTISCPCALHVNITTELTTRATVEITIAPRAALILGEPSFKQMVHVAADTPESIAKRIADVGTFTSLFWVIEAVAVTAAHSNIAFMRASGAQGLPYPNIVPSSCSSHSNLFSLT